MEIGEATRRPKHIDHLTGNCRSAGFKGCRLRGPIKLSSYIRWPTANAYVPAGRATPRATRGPQVAPSPSHLPACGLACIGQTGSGNPALRHLPGPDAAPAPSDEALADLRCETRSDRPH